MSDYFRMVGRSAAFSPDKAAKVDLWAGERLFVGLNCFEPGQAQKVHAHAGAMRQTMGGLVPRSPMNRRSAGP